MSNDLGLLHPCEVSIAEEMLSLATNFRRITVFCDTYDGGAVDSGEGERLDSGAREKESYYTGGCGKGILVQNRELCTIEIYVQGLAWLVWKKLGLLRVAKHHTLKWLGLFTCLQLLYSILKYSKAKRNLTKIYVLPKTLILAPCPLSLHITSTASDNKCLQ